MMKLPQVSRRSLFTTGITAAGSALGYFCGKKLGTLIGNPLEAAITGFYNITHDTLTEVTAAAEQRLQKSAQEVRNYIGRTEADHQKLSAYWEQVGLLNRQDNKELTRILDNIDHYTKESDVVERLTRLKDRLTKRITAFDQSVESKQPEGLQKFNEWFSKQLKGDERGSRQSLDKYRERLHALVQVYDINKDNKIAMAELLHQTGGYFTQAQDEILKQVDTFLANGTLIDPEERGFFEGLRDLGRQDPSGKNLADYLLNTHNYFTALSASDNLHTFHSRLEKTLQEVTTLQQALEDGIRLKNEIRAQKDADLAHLRQRVTELDVFMDRKKKELEQQGYTIDYELFPKLKAAKESLLTILDGARGLVSGAGALAGGGFSYLVARKAFGAKKMSRRHFLGLKEENERLRKALLWERNLDSWKRKLNKDEGEEGTDD